MLGPLLFVYRWDIVKNFVSQKKNFVTVKKIPKKTFSFYWTWIWKCCKAKKMHKGYWGQKKFQPEKNQNWRCGIHIEKNTLNHTSETQKSVFVSISYFEKCFYMQSLPTANCSLVWPNFCTPYHCPGNFGRLGGGGGSHFAAHTSFWYPLLLVLNA